MLFVYTTEDGVPYTAEDGTLLVVGTVTLEDVLGLITDRTLADVEAVQTLTKAIKHGTATDEQIREYLDVLHKGAYTYRDLNRVEDAVQYVAERLHEFGYLPVVPHIQSWSVEDKPNEQDFIRYFGNVAKLRNAITVWSSTPAAPNSVNGFDVDKANALEQILVDVDQILNHIQASWFYSDDLYSGEV